MVMGYPTANESTSETIILHHFLKGLPDRQATVSVGMTNPTNFEEARTALDTYQGLRDEVNKLSRVGAVHGGEEFVTTTQLHKFGEELKSSLTESVDNKFDEVKSLLKPRQREKSRSNMSRVECYECREYGHFARDCQMAREIVVQLRRASGKLLGTRLSGPTLVPGKNEPVTEVSCKLTSGGLAVVMPLSFHGVKAKFIVDTSAAVTLLASHIYDGIPEAERPSLREPDVNNDDDDDDNNNNNLFFEHAKIVPGHLSAWYNKSAIKCYDAIKQCFLKQLSKREKPQVGFLLGTC